ncbi:peptidylprolyl isomerase [Bryobacter aggregatus]|uniref:peptidylprolyl isomerase n=1 Tax=Bryobacter aggregatus TaxID=360054 RepID=UPI00068ACA7C|nr:peptidylprolyl isomerase [Bryobacter aggregatus]
MRIAGFFLVLACAGFAADVVVVEQIIAKVNGDIITNNDLIRARRQLIEEMKGRKASEADLTKALAEAEKNGLRDRIDNLLLTQKGKDLNISVDGEISKYIADLMVRMKIANQEDLAKMIQDQTGQTFEDWKSEMRNNMITQRVVRQEVGSKINIKKDEVAKYYEAHKGDFIREEEIYLRELLLSAEGRSPAEVAGLEKKAKDIVARARKNEKFSALVREFSDSQTKNEDGDIGWMKRGNLNKAIEDLVFTGQKNFVTDPIKLPNGWLILRVEDVHKEGQAELEQVENEIMEKLYMPRFQPQMREYLTKLRMDAFLEIKEGHLDTGAAPGKNTAWTDPAQLKPETVSKEEVASRRRMKRALWVVPIPGTKSSSSSKSTAVNK